MSSGDEPFLRGGVVLGPMSGYTSVSYRAFMLGFGAETAVTEMVSAQGLVHNPSESGRFLESAPGQTTGVQIFGTDPATMGRGAAIALELNPGLEFVDINMGCPASKVMRTGAGSMLMSSPSLCGEIVRSVKDSVDVPVTAKFRLGIEAGRENWHSVLDSVLDAGADGVTIHTRTADRGYAGRADHLAIEGLGDIIPVPLTVSGDIWTVRDAEEAMDITGASAVMVARGGVGNPYLVTRIRGLLDGHGDLPAPSMRDQSEWCLRLIDMTESELGTELATARMRGVAAKFMAGCRYSREYRRAVTQRCSTLDDIRTVVRRAGAELGDEPFRPNH